MSIDISFTGYVNEVRTMDWGRVLSVSHQQRQRSVNGDGWETVGYDYLDVIPAEHDLVIQKGDLIDIMGKLKTRKYTTKDGEQRMSLQVRAHNIKHKMGQKRGAAAVQEVFGDVPPQVEPETAGWPEPKTAHPQSEIPF